MEYLKVAEGYTSLCERMGAETGSVEHRLMAAWYAFCHAGRDNGEFCPRNNSCSCADGERTAGCSMTDAEVLALVYGDLKTAV